MLWREIAGAEAIAISPALLFWRWPLVIELELELEDESSAVILSSLPTTETRRDCESNGEEGGWGGVLVLAFIARRSCSGSALRGDTCCSWAWGLGRDRRRGRTLSLLFLLHGHHIEGGLVGLGFIRLCRCRAIPEPCFWRSRHRRGLPA